MPPSSHAPPSLSLDLEAAARSFAAMPREEADRMIEQNVTAAIREWRISDATVWQRVKFRSRMIRSTGAHETKGIGRS
jgi:hypothetical protein